MRSPKRKANNSVVTNIVDGPLPQLSREQNGQPNSMRDAPPRAQPEERKRARCPQFARHRGQTRREAEHILTRVQEQLRVAISQFGSAVKEIEFA